MEHLMSDADFDALHARVIAEAARRTRAKQAACKHDLKTLRSGYDCTGSDYATYECYKCKVVLQHYELPANGVGF